MVSRFRFGAGSPEEHDEADRFLEDLLGESSPAVETRATRASARPPSRPSEPSRARRPAPHLDPARLNPVSAPTITPPSTSITAANVTDAGVYTVDPDPAVGRQTVTDARVQATREWLVAHPVQRSRPVRVASREATSDGQVAVDYDHLVGALVRTGFPVSMWGALIANAELATPGATRPFHLASTSLSRDLAEGTRTFSAVRQRLGAPGVRSWLQRAAQIAGIEWSDGSQSELTTSLRQIDTAAAGSTPEATAVSLAAMLAHASLRLHAAFPSASDRATAASSAARLDYPSRVTIPLVATTGGVEIVRGRILGQANALPAALRGQITRTSERARVLNQHFAAEAPSSLAFLTQW